MTENLSVQSARENQGRTAHRTWFNMGGRVLRRATVGVLLVGAAGCLASTQQEVDMGSQYAAQINQQLPIVRDPEVSRYINVLGDSISRVSDERNLNWTFRVVDQPDVNAFAVPGGYIYIYRGLNLKTAARLPGPAGTYAGFGAALAGGGDLDGNDHPDLAIAAPGARRVYIYAGDASGLAADPALVISAPPGSPGEFGRSLAVTTSR